MGERKTAITFEVIIEERNHFTWQGHVVVEGMVIPFQSDLELLKVMGRLLEEHEEISSQWNARE